VPEIDTTESQLVQALVQATKAGTAKWEMATSENEFALSNDAGTVFVGRGIYHTRPQYKLTLLNQDLVAVVKISTVQGDNIYANQQLLFNVLKDLYAGAEKLAKNTDNTVSDFIKGL